MNDKGLTSKELKQFSDLVSKSNNEQFKELHRQIQVEYLRRIR